MNSISHLPSATDAHEPVNDPITVDKERDGGHYSQRSSPPPDVHSNGVSYTSPQQCDGISTVPDNAHLPTCLPSAEGTSNDHIPPTKLLLDDKVNHIISEDSSHSRGDSILASTEHQMISLQYDQGTSMKRLEEASVVISENSMDLSMSSPTITIPDIDATNPSCLDDIDFDASDLCEDPSNFIRQVQNDIFAGEEESNHHIIDIVESASLLIDDEEFNNLISNTTTNPLVTTTVEATNAADDAILITNTPSIDLLGQASRLIDDVTSPILPPAAPMMDHNDEGGLDLIAFDTSSSSSSPPWSHRASSVPLFTSQESVTTYHHHNNKGMEILYPDHLGEELITSESLLFKQDINPSLDDRMNSPERSKSPSHAAIQGNLWSAESALREANRYVQVGALAGSASLGIEFELLSSELLPDQVMRVTSRGSLPQSQYQDVRPMTPFMLHDSHAKGIAHSSEYPRGDVMMREERFKVGEYIEHIRPDSRGSTANPFIDSYEPGPKVIGTGLSIEMPGVANQTRTNFKVDQNNGEADSMRPASWPAPTNASNSQIILISSFHLAYGFIFGSMGLCVLPLEASRLAPESESLALGIMLGICGVSQLVCPIVGKISDHWRSETVYGRRKPFLVGGCLIALAGVILMHMASVHSHSFFFYNLALFVGMIGLNIIYSIQAGLAPDLLVDSDIDAVSSMVAANGLVGSSLGFFLIMATSTYDYHFVYPVYVITAFFTVALTHRTCMTIEYTMPNNGYISGNPMEQLYYESNKEAEYLAQEGVYLEAGQTGLAMNPLPSKLDWTVCPWVYAECTWRSLLGSFEIDRKENEDFFWLFVSRTFYYIGVSVQTFVQPFLRDVAHVATEADQRFFLASIALTAQTVAAVVAVIMGRYTQRTGVSKARLVYIAVVCMCLVYIAFMMVPLSNPYGFQWLMLVSPLYGFGNGCFLAVDYAIAIAIIEKSEAARMLGVWGVSSFVGAAIGPMIFGVVIEVFGGALLPMTLKGQFFEFIQMKRNNLLPMTYSYSGYFSMLLIGLIATAFAGICIRFIRRPI